MRVWPHEYEKHPYVVQELGIIDGKKASGRRSAHGTQTIQAKDEHPPAPTPPPPDPLCHSTSRWICKPLLTMPIFRLYGSEVPVP